MELSEKISKIKENMSYIDSLSIDDLSLIIKEANQKYYYSDNPIFDDNLYDILVNRLEILDKNNLTLDEVSGNNCENKIDLPYFLGSQDKIKFSKDKKKLDNWIKKFKGPYIFTDKLDGISGLLVINNGVQLLTRGDGKKGRDISNILPYINILNNGSISELKDKMYIRGELVISKDNFKKYENIACHSRNFVSGLQNSKELDKDKLKDIDFICYEILNLQEINTYKQMELLNSLNFNTVDYSLLDSFDLNLLNDYYTKRRSESFYSIDGIVVKDNNLHKLNDGKKSKNPKYSFAFKMMIDEQIGISDVVNIEWNVSKDGYLIPRMEIKPINLAGATISYVTCHHADYVLKNNLNIGSKVKIIRSGDVIPYILDVLKQSESPLLPKYDYKPSDSGVDFILVDKKNNNDYNKKLVINFFSSLKIRDLGDSLVIKLINNGYNKIKDILNISEDDLLKIEGIKEKLSKKIFNNLHSRLENIDILCLMVASNCFGRGLGDKKLKIFLDEYPNFVDEEMNKEEIREKLLNIDGFSEKTIQKIIDNIENFKIFYKEQIPNFVKELIKKKPVKNDFKKISILENKNIVLTGTIEIEKLLKDSNVNIQSNVNNKTDLVICKDKNANSSKLNKALEMNVKVIDLKEFIILYQNK